MSKQVTLVSAKYGVKLANNNLTLPVIGVAQLDAQGQLSVDADKVEALIEATKDSIALVLAESKAAKQGEAVSELEQALKEADTTTLLELVKEANLKIEPEKLASMSNDKLIKLLVKQAQELQVTGVKTPKDKVVERGTGDDHPVIE